MAKVKVRIRENAWLARIAAWKLGTANVAIVVGHTVYLHGATKAQFCARPTWVRHELKHVEQYERYGLVGFLWRYLQESRKHGYYANALEIEARAAENDERIMDDYEIIWE